MHLLEPHYSWRNYYIASEDPFSPFYGREYSEFEFSNHIYDHLIHPQWDEFGAYTLYLKILFVDYEKAYCIIELLGEWNDTLDNDIKFLKDNVIDSLSSRDIDKFILIGENVLNYHSAEDDYYQEWYDDIGDGWIAAINFRDHVRKEFEAANLDHYIAFGGSFNEMEWRTHSPEQLYAKISSSMARRLGC